jgi:hypothetical protein
MKLKRENDCFVSGFEYLHLHMGYWKQNEARTLQSLQIQGDK